MEGIGIDIVHIPFISNMIEKHGNSFAKSFLSTVEYEVFSQKRRRKFEYLAGRFAAKEAFFKASNLQIDYKDISIINNANGKPYIVLSEKYKRFAKCNVSISHHIEYAIAIVMLEDKNGDY